MQIIFNLIKIIIISYTSNDLSRYFFHFDITLHKKKRYNCHITFKILLISNYKKLSFQITLLQIWLYELLRTIQTSATTNYSSIPRFGLVLRFSHGYSLFPPRIHGAVISKASEKWFEESIREKGVREEGKYFSRTFRGCSTVIEPEPWIVSRSWDTRCSSRSFYDFLFFQNSSGLKNFYIHSRFFRINPDSNDQYRFGPLNIHCYI